MPPTDLLSRHLLSPLLSLHLSSLHPLSLWIIITHHTGLITTSKRVSMKTLITALGAEHSALIPPHTRMKRESWKQERDPVLKQEICAFFDRDKHSTKNSNTSLANLSYFGWLFMIFYLRNMVCNFLFALITAFDIPRGQFYFRKRIFFYGALVLITRTHRRLTLSPSADWTSPFKVVENFIKWYLSLDLIYLAD